MRKVLLIQTAFLGDVILATALVEKLGHHFPGVAVDLLVRKGAESLLEGHPVVRQVYALDKSAPRLPQFLSLTARIRSERYDLVINLQRFLFTGLLTVLSGAARTVGFDKNPLSRMFRYRIPHRIGTEGAGPPPHEVARNLLLIEPFTDKRFFPPKVYPAPAAEAAARAMAPYLTIAPGSVWQTKRYPPEKWVSFLRQVPADRRIILLGSSSEKRLCAEIMAAAQHPGAVNMAGALRPTETAAYMKHATMNYCQDSAPLHLASAVNAPVTAIYCSTVPAFGFTPLSEQSHILETAWQLPCRPCGLHGRNTCPKGHFRCAEIDTARLLSKLDG